MNIDRIRERLSPQSLRYRSVAGVGGALALWAGVSYGGLVPPDFLPSPSAVGRALVYLHFEQALVRSTLASFGRVTAGFVVSAAAAFPLGVVLGTFPRLKALVWPVVSPMRYLPIAGIVPLTILWFQISETQKIASLFLGSFFYLLAGVVEAVEGVEETYLHLAWTLGARTTTTIFRVLIPGALPAIAESFRVMYGIGWTYILVAEAVAAEYGLGALTIAAQRRAHTDQVFALIAVILVMGYLTDTVFRRLNAFLFSWKEPS